MDKWTKSDKSKREKYSIKYSVDKVKIEFQYIKNKVVQDFMDKLMSGAFSVEYGKYYESNKMTNCKHNFNYGEGAGGIYLGVIPNWRKEERHDKNIVIEYNPNKVDPFILDVFGWLLKIPRIAWRVMNFDIATDIMLPYNTVFMTKRDKRERMRTDGGSEVETRYLGALGNGHIKLYNKAKEQKLEDVDWTRFEITLKEINHPTATLDDFKKVCKVPQLYRKDIQLSCFSNLSDIWNLAIERIIDVPESLYTIKDRKTKKKMEQVLSEVMEDIPVSVENMYKTYIKYFEEIGKQSLELTDEHIDFSSFLYDEQIKKEKAKRWFQNKKIVN